MDVRGQEANVLHHVDAEVCFPSVVVSISWCARLLRMCAMFFNLLGAPLPFTTMLPADLPRGKPNAVAS